MPGGLIQLVNKGAQDQLVTGQPSFTHFRSMYKRHTEFAMEHFNLNFRGVNLDLQAQSSRILRAKVDRNAQLLHDCYVHVNIPDIYSPVFKNPLDAGQSAYGYEFQWIPNLGYNMIKSVSLLINGTAIVTHTGEWLKLYSYLTHDTNKRAVIDRMVGNISELVDPANSNGKFNQYPHALSSYEDEAQPSILGRELIIPLHFWFCEDIGSSIPLVSLQYSEVEIVVEFRSMYELFTIKDTVPTSPTFGKRIKPDLTRPEHSMNRFLGPMQFDLSAPLNPSLLTWSLQPFIEANYIFLSDTEMVHLAKSDNTFMIKELRPVSKLNISGPANDIELTMVNLCTRLVWTTQRTDVHANNGYDNYTNWLNPLDPTLNLNTATPITKIYSSGFAQGTNVSQKDCLVDATLIFDGANREETKSKSFYDLLQNYKHHSGNPLDGIYSYSFALEHNSKQPSGHVNGSMFNKTILRVSTQQPPESTHISSNQVCILKSTAFNKNPTVILNPNAKNLDGSPIYNSEDIMTIVRKNQGDISQYNYNVNVHIESYNFLRITHGIANVVFSS